MKTAIEKSIELAKKGGYEFPESYLQYGGGGCGDDVHFGVSEVKEANVGTKVFYAVAIFLNDPLFWKALGKAMGWEDCICNRCRTTYPEYVNGCLCCGAGVIPDEACRFHWHKFIDHIASGKDPDSFFEELLADNTKG